MSWSVVIHNFRNREEAEVFADWYSGQGEQDSAIWFEERLSEGLPVRRFIESDAWKEPVVDEGRKTVTFWIKE